MNINEEMINLRLALTLAHLLGGVLHVVDQHGAPLESLRHGQLPALVLAENKNLRVVPFGSGGGQYRGHCHSTHFRDVPNLSNMDVLLLPGRGGRIKYSIRPTVSDDICIA